MQGRSLRRYLVLLLTIFCFSAQSTHAQEEEVTILSRWPAYTDAENVLYHHIRRQAEHLLDNRKAAIARLETSEHWRRHHEEVRRTLDEIVGTLPERTPLNPRVTGVIDKGSYRMEKVIFASRPDHYVTAGLFLPSGLQRQAPAVVYFSGHADAAFRSETYQRVILNLVRKGFVVLAVDPVGQGERLLYLDPESGSSKIGGPTHQHSYAGAQGFITGNTLARHMIWDGIRAIDYLVSRREVDPLRIGVTGRSGGGTQAAYVAAFDERVLSSAPENYITNFRRLIASRGPQDAEQNLPHALARGIDHPDLLFVRAPRPSLIIATTRDIFNIHGVRETFAEVQRGYAALGARGAIRMVEDDAAHASTHRNREALYAFFQETLDLPGSAVDEDVEFLSDDDLQITATGQVATALDEVDVHDLIVKDVTPALEARRRARQNVLANVASATEAAAGLSGYIRPNALGEVVYAGRYLRDGYSVEHHIAQGEGEYPLPFLLFVPEGTPRGAVLYLHPEGKAVEAAGDGEIASLARQGFVVLAPDLPGTGAIGPGVFRADSHIQDVSYNLWFGSILVGRSIVGIRAGDVVRLVQILRGRPDLPPDRIFGVARGTMGPVLLHAAAFEPSIHRVALIESLVSYESLVTNRFYRPELVPSTVGGALQAYDLPDLAAALAPRRLLVVDPIDGAGEPLDDDLLQDAFGFVQESYDLREASGHLEVRLWPEDQPLEALFGDWLD